MSIKFFIMAALSGFVAIYTHAQCSAPVVSSFFPLSAAAGTAVTISGSNFDPTLSNNIIYFGAAKATPVTATANQLTVNVPVGATFNYLSVTNKICNLTGYSKQFFNPISVCSGTFSTSTVDQRIDYSSGDVSYGPYAILFGDFDSDGKTDVVYPTGFGTTAPIVIARNQSVPGLIDLSSAIPVSAGLGTIQARNMAVSDIDGDGKLDIIFVEVNLGQVRILRNTSSGPGNFSFAQAVIYTTNSQPYQVTANDIDGDGRPDLVVGHFGSNFAAVFKNNSISGNISFGAKQDINIPGYSVALADVDGDNNVDLLTGGASSLRVCRNISTLGSIVFSAAQSFPGSAWGYRIAVGDLNGDGKNDVAFAESNVGIYRNTSSGGIISFTFSTINTGGFGAHRVAISDLNADGKPDIMATYSGNNQVACALNTTSAIGGIITFGSTPILLSATSCQYALGTADIDGDGNNDVLSGAYCPGGKFNIFRNNVLGLIPVTNSVSQTSSLSCNSTIEINYSAQCNGANSGNVYTAQLSDANGSFAVPINIGSVESTASGTITGTIPSCIATGSGYRIRVVGSNPSTTGTVFGTSLNINCQTITPASISTSTVSPPTLCPGVTINVPFIAAGSFGVCANNTFTAQLSDASGSFASPVNIGSLVSNSSGTISATLPVSISNGTSYRIRVISDQPQKVGTDNGSNITISSENCVQLRCVTAKTEFADANSCAAMVNNIDPEITPANAPVTYTLTGATTGAGNGSVSGMLFQVGTTTVTYTAVDDPSKTCSFDITVADNTAPTITTNGNKSLNNDAGKCGATVVVSATASDNCSVGDPTGARSDGKSLTDDYPVGTTTITWNVTDANGNAATPVSQTVTVTNANPTLSNLTAPTSPVALGSTIAISVPYVDNNATTATIEWGDGQSSNGQINSDGTITGSYKYPATGVYTLKVTLSDACSNDANNKSATATAIYQYVVVYDPSGGFITGGGWINSPAGAYLADLTSTGKANFGFVSKYQKGTSVPTGNTQFEFHAGDLNFKSTSYDWLVISGTTRGQFKGSGAINGFGDYGFLLSAVDGHATGGDGVDRFRIKIWHKVSKAVVYDNQLGEADDAVASMAIESGSIVIHTPTKGKTTTTVSREAVDIPESLYTGRLNVTALPNPSRGAFTLKAQSGSTQSIKVKVLDILGRVLESKGNISSNKTFTIGESYRPGVYYVEVVQGTEMRMLKLVKQ